MVQVIEYFLLKNPRVRWFRIIYSNTLDRQVVREIGL